MRFQKQKTKIFDEIILFYEISLIQKMIVRKWCQKQKSNKFDEIINFYEVLSKE